MKKISRLQSMKEEVKHADVIEEVGPMFEEMEHGLPLISFFNLISWFKNNKSFVNKLVILKKDAMTKPFIENESSELIDSNGKQIAS